MNRKPKTERSSYSEKRVLRKEIVQTAAEVLKAGTRVGKIPTKTNFKKSIAIIKIKPTDILAMQWKARCRKSQPLQKDKIKIHRKVPPDFKSELKILLRKLLSCDRFDLN